MDSSSRPGLSRISVEPECYESDRRSWAHDADPGPPLRISELKIALTQRKVLRVVLNILLGYIVVFPSRLLSLTEHFSH